MFINLYDTSTPFSQTARKHNILCLEASFHPTSFLHTVTTSRILICMMSSEAKKSDFHRQPYHYPFPIRTRPAPLWLRPSERRSVTKQKRIAKTTLTGQGRRSAALEERSKPFACDCEIVPVLEDIRNEHSP